MSGWCSKLTIRRVWHGPYTEEMPTVPLDDRQRREMILMARAKMEAAFPVGSGTAVLSGMADPCCGKRLRTPSLNSGHLPVIVPLTGADRD
jgi:hypothetical protein